MKEVVVREELEKGVHLKSYSRSFQSMSWLEAEVSIPLVSKGSLIGMINLAIDVPMRFNSTRILNCSTCWQNQAAIAIEKREALRRSETV